MDLAVGLGDQAYRKAYDSYSRVATDPRTRNVRLSGLMDERAGGAVDLAREIASLLLHTAVTVGEDLVQAAEQLESLIAKDEAEAAASPSADGGRDSAAPGAAGEVPAEESSAEPASLALQATTPGRSSSGSFHVRNASFDRYDGIRLRCGGLFGTGDIRIAGSHVSFAPPVVDIEAQGSARITCTVEIPPHAKRGHYIGMIEAAGLTGVTLLISLDVI